MSDLEKIQEKEEKWYFAIEDVIAALTESRDLFIIS